MKKNIRGLSRFGHRSHMPKGSYLSRWFGKFIESTLERERKLYITKK